MHFRNLIASAALALILAIPTAHAIPITADSGWISDEADALFANSTNSSVTFTVSAPTYFTITDAFQVGDNYQVLLSGTFTVVLQTATGTLPTFWTPGFDVPDFAYADADYSKGQILLAPGSYSWDLIDVASIAYPAGFYYRLDTQREPIAEPVTLTLIGSALLGLGLVRRRR